MSRLINVHLICDMTKLRWSSRAFIRSFQKTAQRLIEKFTRNSFNLEAENLADI